MRLTSLLCVPFAVCLTAFAGAQSVNDDLRAEIRRIVREEVRAALKDLHADTGVAATPVAQKAAVLDVNGQQMTLDSVRVDGETKAFVVAKGNSGPFGAMQTGAKKATQVAGGAMGGATGGAMDCCEAMPSKAKAMAACECCEGETKAATKTAEAACCEACETTAVSSATVSEVVVLDDVTDVADAKAAKKAAKKAKKAAKKAAEKAAEEAVDPAKPAASSVGNRSN